MRERTLLGNNTSHSLLSLLSLVLFLFYSQPISPGIVWCLHNCASFRIRPCCYKVILLHSNGIFSFLTSLQSSKAFQTTALKNPSTSNITNAFKFYSSPFPRPPPPPPPPHSFCTPVCVCVWGGGGGGCVHVYGVPRIQYYVSVLMLRFYVYIFLDLVKPSVDEIPRCRSGHYHYYCYYYHYYYYCCRARNVHEQRCSETTRQP